MLFGLREFGDNPPALFAFFIASGLAFVIGVAYHEACHAWLAHELGDDTAARAGRLTLNPIKHMDRMGTLMFVLIGIGWGSTPVNPWRLRYGPRKGGALVAGIGPVSNLAFATLFAIPIKIGLVHPFANFSQISEATGGEWVGLLLFFLVYFNVLLGCFNLLPIYPLDGFKVVLGLLPRNAATEFEKLAPWGQGTLMALFVLGFLNPALSPIGFLLNHVVLPILRLLIT